MLCLGRGSGGAAPEQIVQSGALAPKGAGLSAALCAARPRPPACPRVQVLGELRAQLNAVLHMVWEVRQLSDQLSKEIGMDEAVSALAKSHGGGPGGMPNGL